MAEESGSYVGNVLRNIKTFAEKALEEFRWTPAQKRKAEDAFERVVDGLDKEKAYEELADKYKFDCVDFMPVTEERLARPSDEPTIEFCDDWKGVRAELRDFLSESKSQKWQTRLVSAVDNEEISGLFVVRSHHFYQENLNNTIDGMGAVLNHAAKDGYPLRFELFSGYGVLSMPTKAIIRNYNDDLEVGEIWWEEWKG